MRALWIIILAVFICGCSVSVGRPPAQAPGTPASALAMTLSDRLDALAQTEPPRLEYVIAQMEALSWALDQAKDLPLPQAITPESEINPYWSGEGSTLVDPAQAQAQGGAQNNGGLSPLQPLQPLGAGALSPGEAETGAVRALTPLGGDQASQTNPTPESQAASQLATPPPGPPANVFSNMAQASSALYALHVASYRNMETLNAGWQEIAARYPALMTLNSRYERVDLGQRGVFLQLNVGPFLSRQAAGGACRNLRESGLYCALVSFEGESVQSSP